MPDAPAPEPAFRQRAIRHHVVPRFYLARFADEGHRLVAFDAEADDEETVSPKRASVISDFYTIDIGAGPSDEIERRLSEIEALAAAALRRIDEGTFPPSDADRGAIASFMALQFVRGPDFRALQDHTATLMMRGVSQVMASVPEHVRSIWKEAVGTDPTEEDVAGAVETLARGDVTVALAREHQIAVMLECGAAVFPFFFGRRWFLARGRDLVTSDNPVILWARNVPRGGGVGAMTADEVVVPIAPDRALVLLHPTVGTEESVVDLSESKSALLASRVRSYARRFTYRRPGTPLPPPLEMSAPTASAPTRGAAPADPEPSGGPEHEGTA